MIDELKIISDWLGSGSINVFGRPFSGKDTQGKKLAALLGGIIVGGGEILRSRHEPLDIERDLSAGKFAPSDYYISTVLPYLSRQELAGKPLLLSSVGRAHGEEQPTIDAATAAGHPIKAVVYLEFPEDEVWQRFHAAAARGDRGSRNDDTEEALRTRLERFNRQTVPVIEFYKAKGLLITVDGTPAPDSVTAEIIKRLAEFAKRSAA